MLRYAISDGSLALGQPHAQPADPTAALPSPATPSFQVLSSPAPMSAAPSSPARQAADLRERLLTHAACVASRRIDFFLLREPTLPAGELVALSRELLRIFAATPTRLLIHSRPDIAIATHAHGVHLPSTPGQLTPAQIRTLYTSAYLSRPTISLSCHTEDDLHHARTLQPDLILFGPIFGKQIQGKSIHPGTGLEPLRRASTLAAPISVLALGGITEATTAACLEAGAAGIAAIRLFQPPAPPV